jgi:Tfp pilus assembly protein PilF
MTASPGTAKEPRMHLRFIPLLASLLLAATQIHAVTAPLEAARLNNLGTAYMNQQLLEKAAEEFAAAYAADPALPIAKLNEALAFLYLQKLPQAHAALEIAIRQSPSDPHVWYAFGLLARAENDSPKALEAFKHTLTLDPNDADTHYMVASLDLELNDVPSATAEFRRALALQPLHASAQFGLARCLQRQGDTSAAKAAFATFQHIVGAKLGFPISHTYGEEGRYAHVEDATLATPTVGPMIPVTFKAAIQLVNPGNSVSKDVCRIDSDGTTSFFMNGSLYQQTNLNTPDLTEVPVDRTHLRIPPGLPATCAVGDFDNDGRPDLAIGVIGVMPMDCSLNSIFLFRNIGNNTFQDVTKAVGIKLCAAPTSLLFVDYDHDGDLDLISTGEHTKLWRNNGNLTFTDWTDQAALNGNTEGATISDLNNDRAIDIVTIGDGPPTIYTNHREGPFTASALYPGGLPRTTSIQTFDFNKDGLMDILVTHSGVPDVTLWRNQDGKHFMRIPLPLPAARNTASAIPIDFDNDGWIDIAATIETPSGWHIVMLRNEGPAGFRDATAQLGLDKVQLAGSATLLASDFTYSGATDLLVTQSDGSLLLLSNVGGNKNHSLPITLAGLADNKSAIGAKVEVFANGLWQKWEIATPTPILAGLGTATHADLIRILWPTGVPQDEIIAEAPASSSQLTAQQLTALKNGPSKPLHIDEIDRRGSSCPTLFAWDGAKYTFVADTIGAAVIGHWTSPTTHNIPDPDEWIKVSGTQLTPRNGNLSLRFGEPMEEVNFADQVRLLAIDHPAQTAVVPNEGFLSEPPFAKTRTIATQSAHPLAAAHDNDGRDVLETLRIVDKSYVRDFTNLPAYAGFANLHTLTLDLGPWTPTNPLKLLLHGFIEYFSASSMYSAWQAGLAPIPPYVEAQFPDGSWHRVLDDMGFPAGLPRTVTVDLTGKLPPGTRNLRIATNLQIYWDQILVANEPDAPQTRQTELPLTAATLAFRGYPLQADGHTPGDLNYDYQRMSPTGPFIPHRGAYTRYGDVTPLLTSIDDQFVIFGTGEDMDLEFSAAALPPLPTGWTRDFFFYANGFVKDMDFYEGSPFEVGQLPFHGMSTYPYPTTEHYPNDPAHIRYQLEYNTRWEPGITARPFEFQYPPKP